MKCIFCEEELTDATKPEHILLSCLGGRKTTRRADCSAHNETFGSTIDKEVAEQVRVIRNLLQLESGTGKPPPGLKGIKAGSEIIDFDNDGNPVRTKSKPFTITPKPDGSADIEIRANDAEHLKAIIPHIAAAARMTEAQVTDLIANSKATYTSERPGTVHHQLSFGGGDALRSAVKSALALWTLEVGNEEVRSANYADARDFVLKGGDFNVRKAHLDSRPIPDSGALTPRFGDFFNLLYVASSAQGRVVGHFTLYNMIGWHFVLAEQGGTPGRHTGLINNPLQPELWSDTIAAEASIPFDWFNSPTYVDHFVRARERVTRMMEKHTEDARNKEWDHIIRDVFDKNGIAEGAAITDPQIIQKISAELAQRVAAHSFNIPYAEPLTPEQIAKLLAD